MDLLWYYDIFIYFPQTNQYKWTKVHIVDGFVTFERVSHEWRKPGLLGNKLQIATAVDLDKCLKQIKLPGSL